MPNPIVTLVEKEMATFRELRLAHEGLFPSNPRLYPVPFFGDIRRAEVLTVALNPSHREFDLGRLWPVGQGEGALTPVGLTNRLLSYFHHHTVPQNSFFDACEEGLQAIGCSYKTNSAHIDIHPFPSHFVADITPAEAESLRRVTELTSTDHLIGVLGLCKQAKLIVVKEFYLPGTPRITTFTSIWDRLPPLAGLLDGTGFKPPLLNANGPAGISAFLLQHQVRLRDFLHTAPTLVFSP